MGTGRFTSARLLAGVQCAKRLWRDEASAGRAPAAPSAIEQAQAEAALEVTRTARGRWPGGVVIEARGHAEAVAATRATLADPTVPAVFRAAFAVDGLEARVDVLARTADSRWEVVSVKAAGSPRPAHEGPLAVQVHLARASGLAVARAGVLHLDTGYVLGPEGLDLDRLFRFMDLLPRIESLARDMPAQLAAARAVLAGSAEPEVEPGPQCHSPRTCPHVDACIAPPERYSVERLPRSEKLVARLAVLGVSDLREIPPGVKLSIAQARARDCIVSGRPFLAPALVRRLRRAPWPRRFLDFESASFPVPWLPGTGPFTPLPTQWSLHTVHASGGRTHAEFLHDGGGDPRRPFLEALLRAVGEDGCVVVYSSYEETLLRTLAAELPEHAPAVERVLDRKVDLLAWLRDGYDHPELAGRHSIKRVLPVLVPALGYGDLAVHDGNEAALAYRRLIDSRVDPDERAALREALLRYCERDTLAMVEVWAALEASG